jgi:hypothetical protein
MRKISYGMFLITFFGLMSVNGCTAEEKTFQGKVIDAETLKPIEGAVVVAVWNESRATPISMTTRFKGAKETLTDKNGDWSITGPKGMDMRDVNQAAWLASAALGNYFLEYPTFTIYKPGYGRPILEPGSFTAFPYASQERNIEGIILVRPGKTEEERRQDSEEYGGRGWSPFIPVKDPEAKLRKLEFTFEYPEGVMKLGTEALGNKGIRAYFVYTVTGLVKVTTKEERLRAMPSLPVDGEERLPLLLKMINEDRVRLGYKPTGGKGK